MGKKSLKKIIATGIASAIIACSSASAQDFSFNGRLNYLPRSYVLSLNESKTIGVHPDDASFLSGTTEVKAGSGIDLLVLDVGVEARYGKKMGFNIFSGADFGIDYGMNEVNYSGGKREDWGMLTTTQQSSDTRPESSGSFVYDKLQQNHFSLIPFLGVGYRFKKWALDFEYGIHSRSFKREWGHHRNNNEESVGSEDYSSIGNRFSVRVEFAVDKDREASISLQLMLENHGLKGPNNEDVGKLNVYSAGLSYKF